LLVPLTTGPPGLVLLAGYQEMNAGAADTRDGAISPKPVADKTTGPPRRRAPRGSARGRSFARRGPGRASLEELA
jgi:hypothetical protein